MLKNYFKIAWRGLLRKKSFSFINISGLAVGMAVCMLLMVYIKFEVSYDKFHKNHENLYRSTITAYRNGEVHANVAWTYRDMGEAMKNEIPEIKEFCRYHPNWGGAVVSYEGSDGIRKEFLENNMAFADSTFLTMFSFPIIKGSTESLSRPNSIVLTPDMVKKYFGDETVDPVGEILDIQGGWASGQYTITGVIEIPQNSQIHPDFIMSFYNLLQTRQYQEDDGWGWSNFYTYVALYPNSSLESLRPKLDGVINLHLGEHLAERNQREEIYLEKLTDVHLYSEIDEDDTDKSSATNVYLFTAIAIFILIIAWVNYINLSTSKAMERAKEVGIKKSIGAHRYQLMVQFLAEAFLINILAFIISIGITYLAMPSMNQLIEKQLSLKIMFSPEFLSVALVAILLGTLLSGFYPALILSSYNPVSVLKGSMTSNKKGNLLRKSLVVFQFVCSFFLIAGTFAILRQVDFMKSQKLGLDLDQVFIVTGPNNIDRENLEERLETFKTEAKRNAAITGAATSANIPGGGYNLGTTLRRVGADVSEASSANVTWVDKDFINTYKLELLTGRDFSDVNPEGPAGIIVNEAAIEAFGLGNPEEALTHQLIAGNDSIDIRGVMKNYNWDALQRATEPVLLVYSDRQSSYFSFKINSQSTPNAIAHVESLYKEMFPGNPFEYYFADEFYNRQYKNEVKFGKIFGIFAALAIIVACLGLLGLASYTAALRQKEVGIRKVLGASASTIVYIFSGYFLKLMIVAALIGVPIIYFAINSWLEGFAYRIAIGWDLFILPAIALIVIISMAISFQTAKTALLNPAKTLRSE